MTAVRWTEPASADFLSIVEWLKERNPSAAARIGRRILHTVERLEAQPYLGKPGRVAQTREIRVAGSPHLVVYSIGSEAPGAPQIVILRVLHGAMLWPRPDAIRPD